MRFPPCSPCLTPSSTPQHSPYPHFRIIVRRVIFGCSLSLGDMEDLNFDFQLTSAPAAGAAAAGWCVRCPKHRKKFCGGLYFSVTTGHAYVKGIALLTFVFTSFILIPSSYFISQDPPRNLKNPGASVRACVQRRAAALSRLIMSRSLGCC